MISPMAWLCSLNRTTFLDGSWEDVQRAGEQVAGETMQAIEKGLKPIKPVLSAELTETVWPAEPALDRAGYEKMIADPPDYIDAGGGPQSLLTRLHRMWIEDMLVKIDKGYKLQQGVPVLVQGAAMPRAEELPATLASLATRQAVCWTTRSFTTTPSASAIAWSG